MKIDTTPCFHCAEPCPPDSELHIRYHNVSYPVCCIGCKAVAETIISSGLDQYYAQREKPADRKEPLPTELLEQLSLYDDTQLQADFVHQTGTHTKEAALILEGISCAACIWLNEQHIAQLKGVQSVSINYSSYRARICWDDSQIQLSTILEHIAAIGYRAVPYDHARDEVNWQKQRKSALFRLWVAGLSMMQVMMFVVPIYLSADGEIEDLWLTMMHWGSALLTLPVVLYSCWPFYRNSWRDLRHGRAGMDLPVSLGVLIAFFASVYSLITQHGEIYFDSVSMFVFLLLSGRYLELKARRNAGAAAEKLVKLVPTFAHQLHSDQSLHETAVARLKVGDQIVVKAGEIIPIDGIVLDGNSDVNEAMLTGESHPIQKTSGSNVTAGTSNLLSPLTIEVKLTGANTRIAGMVRILDQALEQKPRLAAIADRISGWFVLGLLLAATLTFWYWRVHDPVHALPITVALLVISCPCALSLATPTALTAATGHLAQLGLLVTRANLLETMAGVTDIVLDKTGTLTYGEPRIVRAIPLALEAQPALQIAQILESQSEHPIAKAFAHEGKPSATVAVTQVQKHAQGGLSGIIDGQQYWIGSLTFIANLLNQAIPHTLEQYEAEGSIIALSDGNTWLAAFVLADSLRPEAAELIHKLHQSGFQLHLVSGDQLHPVNHIAEQLQINNVRAQATPEAKVAYIQALQSSGKIVLMIGDGVNDAPVLALANVSIAMGAGVDIAHAAGDMVLLNNNLACLPAAFKLAKKTQHIIKQNLLWALLYNIAALPLAAAGFVTPWLASIGMAMSSLLVVLNALRLIPSSRKKNL
ncbi:MULTISPECIES: heavy metal translocating P-type ATPase [Deefgea]|uniref:heavy metal translocating P-type ATPase n=1 Tax=Deefgea TaxID=400947 RepID=UPI0019431024|nr:MULTISPECIES: heavy metal translocating P-type ATPase [Deefgea]MBM9887808.1 heavy metal translocating P-type ATPase [Deefgea sp. CFH1-16]